MFVDASVGNLDIISLKKKKGKMIIRLFARVERNQAQALRSLASRRVFFSLNVERSIRSIQQGNQGLIIIRDSCIPF